MSEKPSPTSDTHPPGRLSEAEAGALQAVLAAANAAVYAYGIIGGQGPATRRNRMTARLDQHGARRDAVAARLSAVGRRPAPAAAAYALPFPVRSMADLPKLGAHVERALAVADAGLVAAAAPGRRVEAADWLAEDARAAAAWQDLPEPFPGLPERATRPSTPEPSTTKPSTPEPSTTKPSTPEPSTTKPHRTS
jgi:hypothetical protein